MRQPYEDCSNFFQCSANVCPLDPYSKEKETLKGEAQCGKSKRDEKWENLRKLADTLRNALI